MHHPGDGVLAGWLVSAAILDNNAALTIESESLRNLLSFFGFHGSDEGV